MGIYQGERRFGDGVRGSVGGNGGGGRVTGRNQVTEVTKEVKEVEAYTQ